MLTQKQEKISKLISYALRHKPEEFGLVLDEAGFVSISELIDKLNQKEDCGLTRDMLYELLEKSEKQRWEMRDTQVRAIYGHSLSQKITKNETVPPKSLYHGTAHKYLESILAKGLVPKQRQYVHLSSDMETAILVGKRRDATPVLLEIKAIEAYQKGHKFYYEKDDIWLADPIPSHFIEIIN